GKLRIVGALAQPGVDPTLAGLVVEQGMAAAAQRVDTVDACRELEAGGDDRALFLHRLHLERLALRLDLQPLVAEAHQPRALELGESAFDPDLPDRLFRGA